MINLLQKENRQLRDLIREKRYQVERLQQQLKWKKEDLARLQKEADELEEEMNEFCMQIAELREYKHPMKITEKLQVGGLIQELLSKVGVKNVNLRALGIHWSDNFEAVCLRLPEPHSGTYMFHLFRVKDERKWDRELSYQ